MQENCQQSKLEFEIKRLKIAGSSNGDESNKWDTRKSNYSLQNDIPQYVRVSLIFGDRQQYISVPTKADKDSLNQMSYIAKQLFWKFPEFRTLLPVGNLNPCEVRRYGIELLLCDCNGITKTILQEPEDFEYIQDGDQIEVVTLW
jgi:hypothetical protein